MSVAAIICAAGKSQRFGGKRRKPFVDVGGRAAFLRCVEIFTDFEQVKQVILAIPPEESELVNVKWGPNLKFFGVEVCTGAEHRFETVKAALDRVRDDIELVAVHDAARCCLRKEWVEACFEAAGKNGAAIPACPVSDTIKRVAGGKVVETVDRGDLWIAQTPQVFKTDLLRRAYGEIDKLDRSLISDDCRLVEAIGGEVAVVRCDPTNMKITVGGDIAIAEAIIKSRPRPGPKGPVGPYYEAQW
jgi:2-C-methyl-D-erythritol 4-phosphate cytidylyltransferase